MGAVFGRITEELPRHTVLATFPTYNIRRYEPSIAAISEYSSAWGTSSDSTPFGALARECKIQATVPFALPERT